VRAAGVEPIYVVIPVALPSPQARALVAHGLVAPVWAFNDPDAFPAIYEVSNRFDLHHLSNHGARLFSPLLAERFAAELEPSAHAEHPVAPAAALVR
jgi:hypothetical protein